MKTRKYTRRNKTPRSRSKRLLSRKRKYRNKTKKGGWGIKWYKKCFVNWQCKKGECCKYTGFQPASYGIGFSRHSCQPC